MTIPAGQYGLATAFTYLLAIAVPALAADDSAEGMARSVLQQAPAALCPTGILNPISLGEGLAGALSGFGLADVEDRGRGNTWARREIRLENAETDQALLISASGSPAALRRVTFEVHRLTTERPIMMALAPKIITASASA